MIDLPIPQKPPFLFVDEIISQEGNKITTLKKLTGKEDFFKGHFPDFPLMPGVLLCEAMLQSGALLLTGVGKEGEIGVVVRVDGLKLKNPVFPGDTLNISVTLTENINTFYWMEGKIEVSGKTAASCRFCCSLVHPDQIKKSRG